MRERGNKMFETSMDVNGYHIEIITDWVGEKPSPLGDGNDSARHNEITICVGDVEETFDAWGSINNPQFDDDESAKQITRYIFGEALDVMWGQMDEVLEGYSYSQARQMADQLEENARKVENLGIDEDTLTQIVNEGCL